MRRHERSGRPERERKRRSGRSGLASELTNRPAVGAVVAAVGRSGFRLDPFAGQPTHPISGWAAVATGVATSAMSVARLRVSGSRMIFGRFFAPQPNPMKSRRSRTTTSSPTAASRPSPRRARRQGVLGHGRARRETSWRRLNGARAPSGVRRGVSGESPGRARIAAGAHEPLADRHDSALPSGAEQVEGDGGRA